MRQEDIKNWFTYHAPTPEQLKSYEVLRSSARMFAEDINEYVPDCPDKTAAIRKLRECVMTANAAIACYQKPTIESLEAILKADDHPEITINSDGSISTAQE